MDQVAVAGDSQAAHRMMLYDAGRKNTGVAFALWFFLGMVGAHRFYMGKTGTGILMIILDCTVVGLVVTAVWAIIDAFCIPGWVRDHNLKLIAPIR